MSIIPRTSPSRTLICQLFFSVLLEFVADLKPDSHLLPKDPVERAKVRFFIDAVGTKFSTPYFAIFFRNESGAPVLAALETIQDLLSPAGFAVGAEPTIADFALLPFLARGEIAAKENLVGGAVELFKGLQEPKFEKLWTWFNKLKARPSFKETFDEVFLRCCLGIFCQLTQ